MMVVSLLRERHPDRSWVLDSTFYRPPSMPARSGCHPNAKTTMKGCPRKGDSLSLLLCRNFFLVVFIADEANCEAEQDENRHISRIGHDAADRE